MAESYTASQVDARTFGAQQARLLDDLNRPDLSNIVVEYLQDAMRFWQRKAYFFNEIDNTAVPGWTASTIYPQGSTIEVSISGTVYVIVALNKGTSTSSAQPLFTTTLFTVPASPAIPPPASGTAGTTNDNGGPPSGIIWATVAKQSLPDQYTQLATVYNINQYVPPIDYSSPKVIECTWSGNIRKMLDKVPYETIRYYDVIRPTPPSSYPVMWAWFQQQIYLWPYPNAFYPLTLSYNTAPQLVVNTGDTNFWTTQGERLIRKYAQAIIEREVIHDADAAAVSMQSAMEEASFLRSNMIAQHSTGGIAPSEW